VPLEFENAGRRDGNVTAKALSDAKTMVNNIFVAKLIFLEDTLWTPGRLCPDPIGILSCGMKMGRARQNPHIEITREFIFFSENSNQGKIPIQSDSTFAP